MDHTGRGQPKSTRRNQGGIYKKITGKGSPKINYGELTVTNQDGNPTGPTKVGSTRINQEPSREG